MMIATADADTMISKVVRRMTFWGFTLHSWENAKLTAALLKFPPPLRPTAIGIVSRLLDPEGSDFADDIASAFSNAHWSPVRQKDWTMSDKGVAIAILEGSANPEGYKASLLAALASVNISATTKVVALTEQNTTSAHFQPNVLYLLVGAKP